MLRKILALFVCVSVSAAVGCSSAGCGAIQSSGGRTVLEDNQRRTKLLQSTVAIVNLTSKGSVTMPYCTGFWVSPTQLVTAKHCVKASYKKMVEMPNGKVVTLPSSPPDDLRGTEMAFFTRDVHAKVMSEGLPPEAMNSRYRTAEVIEVHEKFDLALMEVPSTSEKSKSYLKLAPKVPARGKKLYSIGMPYHAFWFVSDGLVGAKHERPETTILIHNAATGPGGSGGPLVDEYGHLIGVSVSQTQDRNLTKAIGVRHVRELLKEANNNQKSKPKKDVTEKDAS